MITFIIKNQIISKEIISSYDLDFYKLAAIISPFLAGLISGYITYKFTIKSKKFDILYANKIPAFKEVIKELITLKKYFLHLEGLNYSDTAPFEEVAGSAFTLSQSLSSIAEANAVFLSKKSKRKIDNLLDDLGMRRNAELALAGGNLTENEVNGGSMQVYLDKIDNTIDALYNDLNLN